MKVNREKATKSVGGSLWAARIKGWQLVPNGSGSGDKDLLRR